MMRIPSIRQPWAWLVATGIKPIENRKWTTRHRRPLAIQAARLRAAISEAEIERRFGVSVDSKALRFSGIIATVELIDIVDTFPVPWFEGPHAWVLTSRAGSIFCRIAAATLIRNT